MNLTLSKASFSRILLPALLLLGGLLTRAPAQTLAELSQAALAGKVINATITGGNNPFESTGTFAIQIDVPAAGQYTIRGAVSGSTDSHTGAYVYAAGSGEGPHLELKNYFSNGSSAGLDLLYSGGPTSNIVSPGHAYFEMSAPGANKHGTFTLASGSGGGGGPAPVISIPPASQSAALGSSFTFSVTVSGTGLTYQWYFNGQAISGAINATYFINAVTALMAGDYTVLVTNSSGSTTSAVATLTVPVASNPGRIINMSVRTTAASGNQTLIVGVVVGGTGTTGTNSLLIRAAGPTLSSFGVTNVLADPRLTAYAGSTVVDTNDDWAGNADVTAAALRVGAFAFASAQSKDAALLAEPAPGAYSVHVSGSTTTPGIALAEIYEATPFFTTTTPRLINVSARAQVGTGNDVVIAGFVIGGSGPRTVLIRAVGPTLANYGVTGVLADPKLTLYTGSTQTAENDNWSDAANASAISTAATAVGASIIASGSKDAAILVTLQPGVYSAKVSGVANTTGVALVEVYEAP